MKEYQRISETFCFLYSPFPYIFDSKLLVLIKFCKLTTYFSRVMLGAKGLWLRLASFSTGTGLKVVLTYKTQTYKKNRNLTGGRVSGCLEMLQFAVFKMPDGDSFIQEKNLYDLLLWKWRHSNKIKETEAWTAHCGKLLAIKINKKVWGLWDSHLTGLFWQKAYQEQHIRKPRALFCYGNKNNSNTWIQAPDKPQRLSFF